MSARGGLAVLLMGGALVARPVHAQSAQPWSVQASFLAASQNIGSKTISGSGFEAQFRYTPVAAWSLGAGLQYSLHPSGGDEIDIAGVFVEPRYAVDIGSDRFAPYIAARLAVLSESLTLAAFPGVTFTSAGSAFGGGAGLLIRATKKINVDIGAAFVRQSFSNATQGANTVTFPSFTGYIAKGGVSIGFGSR